MKITVRRSFLIYLLLVYLLSSPETCIGMLAALAIHELSHLAVMRLLKEPVQCIELAPFGGVLTYQNGRTGSKGIKGMAIAAAGPLGNYAMILLLNALPKHLGRELIRQTMIGNLSMLIINLIPALPLDGGMLLFCAGYYLFEIAAMIRVLCSIGILTGAFLCILGVYGWVRYGVLNISMLIVGAYLMHTAAKEKESMISRNMFIVVQEKISARKHIQRQHMYTIHPDVRVIDLLSFIARKQSTVFWVEGTNGCATYLREADICKALLEQPLSTVEEVIENNIKKKCISP